MIDLAPGASLLDWGALWTALESELGEAVDVAVAADLRPELRALVLHEAVAL